MLLPRPGNTITASGATAVGYSNDFIAVCYLTCILGRDRLLLSSNKVRYCDCYHAVQPNNTSSTTGCLGSRDILQTLQQWHSPRGQKAAEAAAAAAGRASYLCSCCLPNSPQFLPPQLLLTACCLSCFTGRSWAECTPHGRRSGPCPSGQLGRCGGHPWGL